MTEKMTSKIKKKGHNLVKMKCDRWGDLRILTKLFLSSFSSKKLIWEIFIPQLIIEKMAFEIKVSRVSKRFNCNVFVFYDYFKNAISGKFFLYKQFCSL